MDEGFITYERFIELTQTFFRQPEPRTIDERAMLICTICGHFQCECKKNQGDSTNAL